MMGLSIPREIRERASSQGSSGVDVGVDLGSELTGAGTRTVPSTAGEHVTRQ